MKASFDFTGKTVMIAGAASGIGSATVSACLAAGAKVLAMDIDAAGLSALPRDERLQLSTVDISDSAAVGSSIQGWVEVVGRVDAAVISSAIQRRASIDAMTDSDWQRHLDVNLSGTFYTLRHLFPIMKQQRFGAIVAFTSGLATNGWPGAAAYAATKAGIIGLVKCAALELRSYGVRINALSPGLVATPVFLKSASSEELAMYERTLGVSTPEEVVPTILYLISDAAVTMSGNVVERRLIPRIADS